MSTMGQIKMSENSRKKPVRALVNRILQLLANGLPLLPSQRVWIHRRRGVRIGKNVFIGIGVLIDDAYPEKVIIEDKATIIARSIILAHSIYPNHFQKVLKNTISETKIKEGAYIGAASIILPGVIVGKYSIIGAGSVVTKSIPDYSKAVGSPARAVGKIDKNLIQ